MNIQSVDSTTVSTLTCKYASLKNAEFVKEFEKNYATVSRHVEKCKTCQKRIDSMARN